MLKCDSLPRLRKIHKRSTSAGPARRSSTLAYPALTRTQNTRQRWRSPSSWERKRQRIRTGTTRKSWRNGSAKKRTRIGRIVAARGRASERPNPSSSTSSGRGRRPPIPDRLRSTTAWLIRRLATKRSGRVDGVE